MTTALHSLTSQIDVAAIYAKVQDDFNTIVAANDYDALLQIYNRKSLVHQATNALGLKAGELTALVLRLIRGDCREVLTTAVKNQFGTFTR